VINLDRRVIIVIGIVVIAISAVLYYMGFTKNGDKSSIEFTKNGEETPITVENVGGKYNATISSWEDHIEVEYTDEEGKHTEGYFEVEMRSGLDWIKTNTPESSTFLCWWDYGHMIKGYAERNTVVRNPSEEIKESVGDPSSITEFDPHEKILDVAAALTTSNFTVISGIMEKYCVTHILVCPDDLYKAGWMYRIAGLEPTDYIVSLDPGLEFTDTGMQTMIARLLGNRDTGFTLIHEDAEIKVYSAN